MDTYICNQARILLLRPGRKAIGRTVISSEWASTTDSFWFALRPRVIVNVFDFVTVDQAFGSRAIGMVKELAAVDGKGRDQIVARVSRVGNTEIMQGRERIRTEMPVNEGRQVFFSDLEEVRFGLGVPEMNVPIPAGVIEMSNGMRVPISFDVSYLLGPDTAHINAAGISGNSKTTYLLFLLQSIYERLHGESAFILFNTKPEDLLHLHERHPIEKQDRELYRILGVKPEPLSRVKYFLPRGSDGKPNSAFIPPGSRTYSFELEDIYGDLDMLFLQQPAAATPGIYSSHDVASIINYISETWPNLDRDKPVKTWSELAGFTEYPSEIVAHRTSVLKFLSQLYRIRRSSLFIDKKVTSTYLGDEIRQVRAGDVIVVDIGMVPSIEEQSFVVGNVVKTINDLYSFRDKESHSKGSSKPQSVIMFLDEINRFVPKTEGMLSPVADQVMQAAVTGRSRRTILFSAQQFKSTVNPRFSENIGMHVLAKLGLSELAGDTYSLLDQSTKMSISRLNKGEMVMVHPAFRQPVRIVFPKSSLKP